MSFVLNQKDHGYRMAYLLTVEVPYKNPYDVLTKEFSDSALAHNPFQPYLKVNADYRSENPVQRLMYADLKILLPYTYLEKVDKATMLCSLESRVPFLDNDLVEFASALPSRMKIRKGQKKYLLKEALRGLVPDEILFGKKRGFDVPFNKWLKTDLYDYARQTFSAAGGAGILDSSQLIKLLEVHRSGKANYAHLLWKSLVLSAWINAYKGKLTSAN